VLFLFHNYNLLLSDCRLCFVLLLLIVHSSNVTVSNLLPLLQLHLINTRLTTLNYNPLWRQCGARAIAQKWSFRAGFCHFTPKNRAKVAKESCLFARNGWLHLVIETFVFAQMICQLCMFVAQLGSVVLLISQFVIICSGLQSTRIRDSI
jgi:hypothetical protein